MAALESVKDCPLQMTTLARKCDSHSSLTLYHDFLHDIVLQFCFSLLIVPKLLFMDLVSGQKSLIGSR